MELARLSESVGDSMHPVVRAILQSGQMSLANNILYFVGDDNTTITGGWTRTTYTFSGTLSYLTLGVSSMTGSLATATQDRVKYRAVENQIDCSDFTKLKIKLTGSYAGTGYFLARLFAESSGDLATLTALALVQSSVSGTDTVLEIDVSSVSLAYLVVQIGTRSTGSGSASCDIKEIWLE